MLGTVDEAWREGAQLVARIRLSTRPEVAAVVEDVRAGVIRHLSIGYEVAEWRDGTNAQGQRTRTAVTLVAARGFLRAGVRRPGRPHARA